MADVRYVGSTIWSMVVLKDNGSFDKMIPIQPGEIVSLDNDVAKKFTDPRTPLYGRNFVVPNSNEDPYKGKDEEKKAVPTAPRPADKR
jgi:hypothetical protein